MKRYKKRLIYTYVGDILVSLNPFQKLDIYNEKVRKCISFNIVVMQYCGDTSGIFTGTAVLFYCRWELEILKHQNFAQE